MKINFSKIAKSTRAAFTKHSPEILTGIGIAGMISTVVIAVKATPKAVELLEEEKKKKGELKKTEVIAATWKCYIPTTVMGVSSIACIIGASAANSKRNAALATAYTLEKAAFADYKNKVIETIGQKKEEQIRGKIDKEKLEKNPLSNNEVIITNKGGTLCYDAISGRYFKSDIDKIKKIENELNRKMMTEMYISLNEFYYELGLAPTTMGESLGWNISDGLLDIHFGAQISDDNNPCIVLEYHIEPKYDYTTLL